MPTSPVSHRALVSHPFTTTAFSPVTGLDPHGFQSTVLLTDLPAATQAALRGDLDDGDRLPEWTEEDIVYLHWRLLLDLRKLPDLETPLEEKLDTLAWALTDPELDDRPFSFASCLRVVGTSPLSPTGYFGQLDVEDIRDWLRANVRKWIGVTLARYPDWAQELVRRDPNRIAQQLHRNPQWLNEQVNKRAQAQQPDLFGEALPAALN